MIAKGWPHRRLFPSPQSAAPFLAEAARPTRFADRNRYAREHCVQIPGGWAIPPAAGLFDRHAGPSRCDPRGWVFRDDVVAYRFLGRRRLDAVHLVFCRLVLWRFLRGVLERSNSRETGDGTARRFARWPTDRCIALCRWCLDEWRKPPNIAPTASTPSTAAGPNLSRASALEGRASEKATAPRMGIVQGRMTVLRPVAASHSTAEFWKRSPLQRRR